MNLMKELEKVRRVIESAYPGSVSVCCALMLLLVRTGRRRVKDAVELTGVGLPRWMGRPREGLLLPCLTNWVPIADRGEAEEHSRLMRPPSQRCSSTTRSEQR